MYLEAAEGPFICGGPIVLWWACNLPPGLNRASDLPSAYPPSGAPAHVTSLTFLLRSPKLLNYTGPWRITIRNNKECIKPCQQIY
jgi:hypothetical protein